MLIILVDFYDVYMSTNPNYLGPFRNRFSLNLYRKLPLVNSLSLNQSKTVFKILSPKRQNHTKWGTTKQSPVESGGLILVYMYIK